MEDISNLEIEKFMIIFFKNHMNLSIQEQFKKKHLKSTL